MPLAISWAGRKKAGSDNAAKYPPRTVTFADYDTIRILGLAVAFKRSL